VSTINFVRDNTYYKSRIGNPGTYRFGMYSARNTTGSDWTAAEKAAGIRNPHPYSGSRTEFFLGDLFWYQIDFGVEQQFVDSGPQLAFALDHEWDANDELKLLNKLADKYRVSNWNAGIFIGELGKTVDSVAFRARQLAQAAVAVKKLQILKALSILKSKPSKGTKKKLSSKLGVNTLGPAGWWLEIRYAWRPLIKDIYDLSEAIRQKDVPRVKVIKVGHGIKRTVTSSMPTVFAAKGGGLYLKAIIANVTEKPPSLPFYLGLTNPEAIIWELVPLSFVIDWIAPIGVYLETRNVISSISDAVYVRTTYDWYRGSINGFTKAYESSPPTPPPHVFRYTGGFGYSSGMTISRTVVTSLSVPLPTWKNPLQTKSPVKRVLDAIALFSQAVKSF